MKLFENIKKILDESTRNATSSNLSKKSFDVDYWVEYLRTGNKYSGEDYQTRFVRELNRIREILILDNYSPGNVPFQITCATKDCSFPPYTQECFDTFDFVVAFLYMLREKSYMHNHDQVLKRWEELYPDEVRNVFTNYAEKQSNVKKREYLLRFIKGENAKGLGVGISEVRTSESEGGYQLYYKYVLTYPFNITIKQNNLKYDNVWLDMLRSDEPWENSTTLFDDDKTTLSTGIGFEKSIRAISYVLLNKKHIPENWEFDFICHCLLNMRMFLNSGLIYILVFWERSYPDEVYSVMQDYYNRLQTVEEKELFQNLYLGRDLQIYDIIHVCTVEKPFYQIILPINGKNTKLEDFIHMIQ